ncbi:MAG: hypothetical protein EOO71_25510 [Myxococcaceae bacterium]|nr:MAG: hypothetical protein EOO71_25510 [Myxococcaceae bacterium]
MMRGNGLIAVMLVGLLGVGAQVLAQSGASPEDSLSNLPPPQEAPGEKAYPDESAGRHTVTGKLNDSEMDASDDFDSPWFDLEQTLPNNRRMLFKVTGDMKLLQSKLKSLKRGDMVVVSYRVKNQLRYATSIKKVEPQKDTGTFQFSEPTGLGFLVNDAQGEPMVYHVDSQAKELQQVVRELKAGEKVFVTFTENKKGQRTASAIEKPVDAPKK